MFRQIIDYFKYGSMEYRKFKMDQTVKMISLSSELMSVAMKQSSAIKCLKCKHSYEEKKPFATGGIVVNVDKKEKIVNEKDLQDLVNTINGKPRKKG